jgi:predicted transcriptional regulator
MAPRLLPSALVEVIEALRWIDEPLSAADLASIFGRAKATMAMQHNLRRLAGAGAVRVGVTRQVRGVSVRYFRLVVES